jgi:ribosomal protein L2
VSGKQASGATSFLTHKNSPPSKKDRLSTPAVQGKWFNAAWKRIVSDRARNAPLLHLNYRDTRTVMIQNAHGIATNDNETVSVLLDVPG